MKDRRGNNSGLSSEAKAFLDGLASIIAEAIQTDEAAMEPIDEREEPGIVG